MPGRKIIPVHVHYNSTDPVPTFEHRHRRQAGSGAGWPPAYLLRVTSSTIATEKTGVVQFPDSTRDGNSVFLHILNWSGDSLVLPPLGKKILKSELLTGGSCNFKQDDHGVTISVAPSDRQGIDTLVNLEIDGPAMDIPAISK